IRHTATAFRPKRDQCCQSTADLTGIATLPPQEMIIIWSDVSRSLPSIIRTESIGLIRSHFRHQVLLAEQNVGRCKSRVLLGVVEELEPGDFVATFYRNRPEPGNSRIQIVCRYETADCACICRWHKGDQDLTFENIRCPTGASPADN